MLTPLRNWPVWLCALVVVTVVLAVRLYWSFTFPVVWVDETHFIAQAFELYRNHTLFVWGLNTERSVMWMPPGYFFVLAGAYELFGYSFDVSRWVSTVAYLGSFALCLTLVSRALAGWRQWLGLVLLGITFLAPYTLMTANIARMDALYLLIFLLSMFAAIRGLPALGLALVMIGAVVHFNAVYFLLPYAAFALCIIVQRKTLEVRAIELVAMAVALAILGGYASYVLGNLAGFIEDMRFQFQFKDIENPMGGPRGWLMLALVSAVAIVQLVIHRGFSTASWVAFYGVGFYALALNGKAAWYAFAYNVGLCLLLLSVVLASKNLNARLAKGLLVLCFGGVLWLWGSHLDRGESMLDQLKPTLANIHKPLITQTEIDKINMALKVLPQGSRVTFGSTGLEPFFFEQIAEQNLVWSMHVNTVTNPFPMRAVDYWVFCDSVWFPDIFIYDWDGYKRQGQDIGCRIDQLNHAHARN